MQENLLSSRRRQTGGIIQVEGVSLEDHEFVKTAGVSLITTEVPRFHFTNASGWDHLRIPRQNSPQPGNEPTEIELDFKINNFIQGVEAVVIGHWDTNNPPGSYAFCVSSTATSVADYPQWGNARIAITGLKIPLGTRVTMTYRFTGTRKIWLLNGVEVYSYTAAAGRQVKATDWLLGAFTNGGLPAADTSVNARINWEVYGFRVKRI